MDSVKYLYVPGFEGMVRDHSPRVLPDNVLHDCRNVIFKDGKVVRRWGCARISLGQGLGGVITAIQFYKKLNEQTSFILVASEQDIFSYNQSNGFFSSILPSYADGTISLNHGDDGFCVIDGALTAWDVDWLPHYGIIFDTDDPEDQNGMESIDFTEDSYDFETTLSYSRGALLTSDSLPEGTRVVSQTLTTVTMSHAATATGTDLVRYSRPVYSFIVDAVDEMRVLSPKASIYVTTNEASTIVSVSPGFNTDGIVPGLVMRMEGSDEGVVRRVIDDSTFELVDLPISAWSWLNRQAWFYPVPTSDSYVVRFFIAGSIDSPVSFAFPYSDDLSDTMAVIVSYADPPKKWDGEGLSEDLGGDPDYAMLAVYFGAALYEHLVFANMYDEVEGIYRYHRIAVGDAGDPEGWGNAFYDLYQTNSPINAMVMLGNRLVVYKEDSISHVYADPNGDNADPFNIDQDVEPTKGTVAGRSVVSFGTFHIFLGENNIYAYNGMTAIPIGDNIFDDLKKDYNFEFRRRCFAFPIYSENLYVLGIPTADSEYPDKFYVYNYMSKAWSIWTFPFGVTGYSFGERNFSPTFDDLSAEVASGMNVRWMDLLLSKKWCHFLGGADGHVYHFSDEFDTDAGTAIDAMVETKDFDFQIPIHTKKLLENSISFVPYTGSQMSLEMSNDGGATWADPIVFDIDGIGFIRRMCKYFSRSTLFRFRARNVNGSMFELESMNIGFTSEQGLKRG